jgi:uracil-DNA glycosylase
LWQELSEEMSVCKKEKEEAQVRRKTVEILGENQFNLVFIKLGITIWDT